jgi:hypothetical protein
MSPPDSALEEDGAGMAWASVVLRWSADTSASAGPDRR